MSDESTGFDPYDAVLADLRAKRDQIDKAIAAIESLRSGAPIPGGGATPAAVTAPADGPGAYLGMTIPEAAKKLLASRRQPLRNPDIATALIAGGLAMSSAEPANTIGSVLTRRFNDVGDIVKVGRGTWGLKEWYPNRSFKKEKAENGDAKTDPSAPEQPSKPTPAARKS